MMPRDRHCFQPPIASLQRQNSLINLTFHLWLHTIIYNLPVGLLGVMLCPMSHNRLKKVIQILEKVTNTPIKNTESRTASGFARRTSHASCGGNDVNCSPDKRFVHYSTYLKHSQSLFHFISVSKQYPQIQYTRYKW